VEELRGAVETLVMMTVLCTALDMVMPEGTVKKYAKFIFALATMAVLLRPVVALVRFLTEKGP
jgi:stage III sporulation protein AF